MTDASSDWYVPLGHVLQTIWQYITLTGLRWTAVGREASDTERKAQKDSST